MNIKVARAWPPRAWPAVCALALALLAVTDARAGGSASKSGAAPAKTIVNVEANPIFGKEAAVGDGWTEIVARIENVSTAPAKGTLDLAGTSGMYAKAGDTIFESKAAFSLAAGASAFVRFPAHAQQSAMPTLTLLALADDGTKLSPDVTIPSSSASGPLLVDVEATPRLAAALRDWPMGATWNPLSAMPAYGSGSNALSTGAPMFDRTTGDPILPDRAAAYAPVSALVIHSDLLARLEGPSRDALIAWVLSGGTLAVVIARPEDMREGIVATLVGGSFDTAKPNATLQTLPAIKRPPNPSYFNNDENEEGDPLEAPPAPTPPPTPPILFHPSGASSPVSPFIPIHATARPKKPTPPAVAPPGTRIGPLAGVTLTGYAGANLKPSSFGASAAYGMGEVHLLAFDPTQEAALSDGWVHGRMIELVRRAWDRHATGVFPLGAGDRRSTGMSDVRRMLDPNENFRPALGIAAILLVIYSVVSGPLTFMRAMKKGRPLDPLVWTPVWSAVTLSLIVFIGFVGKGFRGRARHLSLVEAQAGAPRASIRRFRGFFSSQTRSLSIPASDDTCVLDVAALAAHDRGDVFLRLDRNGESLDNLTALPWQMVLVAEDGIADLKGGIGVVASADGSPDLVNRTGHDLKDVFVSVPGSGILFVGAVKDGATAHASGGKMVVNAATLPHFKSGAREVHPLDASQLVGAATDGSQAWLALASSAGDTVDWWPDDQPVVLAEMIDGESVTSDSGLNVDSDRLLVRVVGAAP